MSLSKKSQMQMAETIAIVFIFMLLMIFGSLFFVRITSSNTALKNEENMQLKAIEMAQKASFLPEIQCSQDGTAIEDCIDMLKLSSATGIMSDSRVFYFDKFEFSNITLRQTYPSEQEWAIYQNIPSAYSNKKTTFIPTSIFDSANRKFHFGYIQVEVFAK